MEERRGGDKNGQRGRWVVVSSGTRSGDKLLLSIPMCQYQLITVSDYQYRIPIPWAQCGINKNIYTPYRLSVVACVRVQTWDSSHAYYCKNVQSKKSNMYNCLIKLCLLLLVKGDFQKQRWPWPTLAFTILRHCDYLYRFISYNLIRTISASYCRYTCVK
jgi:hypothetical protein